MPDLPIRVADQIVIGIGFLVLLVIGGLCSRRNQTDEGYFLAGRSMPGWVVGFSMMATIVSSMTFLAIPAFAYGEGNWKNCLAHFTYIPAVLIAVVLFIPFFRRSRVSSAYEYLEHRFGLWARLYAGGGFVLFHFMRTGLVLYAVSLAIRSLLQSDADSLPLIIVTAGGLVSAYTIIGGLRAVIWTDVVQGIALILGGLVCLPVIVSQLPGGFEQLLQVAATDNKFDLGSTEFTLSGLTLWAYLFAEFMVFLHLLGTDQTNVQRYAAARSDKEASRAVVVGCCLAVPTWTCFLFLGTSLYVFAKVVPDTGLADLEPDQVFPRFILTQVPAGLAGFVLTGLLASAMSTLDSSINAVSATVTTDFYKRLWVRHQSSRHYATVGKLVSLLFSVAMIGAACGVHFARASETLDDLQRMVLSVLSGGLLSLFLLGFITRRVDGRAAFVAVISTVLCVIGWLVLETDWVEHRLPAFAHSIHGNWVSTFANMVMFAVGYAASFLFGTRPPRDLTGLTIWQSGESDSRVTRADRESDPGGAVD